MELGSVSSARRKTERDENDGSLSFFFPFRLGRPFMYALTMGEAGVIHGIESEYLGPLFL